MAPSKREKKTVTKNPGPPKNDPNGQAGHDSHQNTSVSDLRRMGRRI